MVQSQFLLLWRSLDGLPVGADNMFVSENKETPNLEQVAELQAESSEFSGRPIANTNAYEIQLLIKNIKMKSNSSPNDIPSEFLKIASCIVSEWLSNFFNKCMATREFPDSWKIDHTPIPKVHSPSSSSEYRPISVLPVLSKLFEKVLYHRICLFDRAQTNW